MSKARRNKKIECGSISMKWSDDCSREHAGELVTFIADNAPEVFNPGDGFRGPPVLGYTQWSTDIEENIELVMNQLITSVGKLGGYHSLELRQKDGSLAGVTLASFVLWVESYVVVEDMLVRDDLYGKGIGKIMLDEVSTRARLYGCDHIFLEVCSKNMAAQVFFGNAGFKARSIIMEREL